MKTKTQKPDHQLSSNWKRGVSDRIKAQRKERKPRKPRAPRPPKTDPQAKLHAWERLPVTCPYCSRQAMLVTGKQLYPHREDLHELNFWHCDSCEAYVGTHKKGIRSGDGTRPTGTLADAATRKARKVAFAAFAPIKQSGELSRRKLNVWLASELGLTVDQIHIGIFDVQTCIRMAEICRRRMKQSEMAQAA